MRQLGIIDSAFINLEKPDGAATYRGPRDL
jgi:hypothetical protein